MVWYQAGSGVAVGEEVCVPVGTAVAVRVSVAVRDAVMVGVGASASFAWHEVRQIIKIKRNL
jgi:prefoldin subunit 5